MKRRDASNRVHRGRIGWACALSLLLAPILAPPISARTLEGAAAADAAETCPAVDFPSAIEEAQAPPPPRKIFDAKTTRLFLGVPFVAVPIVGYVAWWKRDWGVHFHTREEGWFGRDTYAGGADKASHFYWGTVSQEAFAAAFRKYGHPPAEARALAAVDTMLCALVVELGDSMTSYGFTWEDAAATMAGAGAYALVSSQGLEDTIGFRMGIVPDFERTEEASALVAFPSRRFAIRSREPDADVPARYSQEIYTMDLRMKGFLPRVGAKPGLARFFFFSVTYGTKGYKAAPPELRERNVGFEIGLSFSELFRAVGVKETTWWGNALLIFLDHFRVPYSAIGVRYDINSGRWYGPDAGNVYDRGPGN